MFGARIRWWQVIFFVSFCAFISSSSSAEEKQVYVPEDYLKIADAIAGLAPEGGTIYLSGGIYDEIIDQTPRFGWNEGAGLTIVGSDDALCTGSISWEWWPELGSLTLRNIHATEWKVGDENTTLSQFALRLENCTFELGPFEQFVVFADKLSEFSITNCVFRCTDYTNNFIIDFQDCLKAVCSDNVFIFPWQPELGGREKVAIFASAYEAWPEPGPTIEISGNRVLADASLYPRFFLGGNALECRISDNELRGGQLVFDYGLEYPQHASRYEVTGNQLAYIVRRENQPPYPNRLWVIANNVFRPRNETDMSGWYQYMAIGDNQGDYPWTFYSTYRIVGNTFFDHPSYEMQIGPAAFDRMYCTSNNFFQDRVTVYLDAPGDMTGNYWNSSFGPWLQGWGPMPPEYNCFVSAGGYSSGTVYAPFLPTPMEVPGLAGSIQGPTGMEVWMDTTPEGGPAPLLVTFRATVTGGTESYQYQWVMDGDIVTTATEPKISWWFPDHGNARVRVRVRDARGTAAYAETVVNVGRAYGRVWGRLFNGETGERLSAGSVAVVKSSGLAVRSGQVKSNGEYAIEKIPRGEYLVEAKAPGYQPGSLSMRISSHGDSVNRDFLLWPVPDARAVEAKRDLIAKLKKFPDVESSLLVSVDKPYVEIETQIEQWLDENSSSTEAVRRLLLAEQAVDQASVIALEYAHDSAMLWGAFIDQTIEFFWAIDGIKKYIIRKVPITGLQEYLLERLGWIGTRTLARVVSTITDQLKDKRTRQAVMITLKEFLKKYVGKGTAYVKLDLKSNIGEVLYRRFLNEYGRKTASSLTFAFAAAKGGSFHLDYEESKREVERTLATMQRKSHIVNKGVDSNTTWGDIGKSVYSAASYIEKLMPEGDLKKLLKILELTYRTLEGTATGGSAAVMTEGLFTHLTHDVSEATANAMGYALAWEDYTSTLTESARAYVPAMETATATLSLPTTNTVNGVLAAVRSAAVADNIAGVDSTLDTQLFPALDSFDDASALAVAQAGLLIPGDCPEYLSMQNAASRQLTEEMLFTFASLDFLIKGDAMTDPNAPTYLEAKAEYLKRIDHLALANDDLLLALLAATSGTQSIVVPVTVVIRDAYFQSGGERDDRITTTPQTFQLAATMENITDGPANGVLVAVEFVDESGLALDGSPATQTIGVLAGGAQQTVTWNVTYDGSLYGSVEHATVQVASDTPEAPQFDAGAPAIALLATLPFPDDDGDGMDDRWEASVGLDNTDPDDGEEDLDGDGLSNAEEFEQGTDVAVPDTDGDGINDGDEIAAGLDPLVADADEDADGDGLSNADELRNGSDPFLADTDGDGYSDGVEVSGGSSPTNSDSTPVAHGMAMGVRDLLIDGRLTAGMDAVHLDANRNGRLDVGDLVKLLAPAGQALDPSTAFTLGPGWATGAAAGIARVPIFLSPGGSAAAFSVEIRFDPNALSLVNAVPGAGLGSGQMALGQPLPGHVIVVGYTDPPAALGGGQVVAELLMRASDSLTLSSRPTVDAIMGDVADPAGNLMPIVNLRSGKIAIATPARHWSLYR